MRLTEKHVSEETLNLIIEQSTDPYLKEIGLDFTVPSVVLVAMALELKQRRAEDRQREYETNPKNTEEEKILSWFVRGCL